MAVHFMTMALIKREIKYTRSTNIMRTNMGRNRTNNTTNTTNTTNMTNTTNATNHKCCHTAIREK